MFESIGRSWRFSVTSYKLLWRNKSLLLFPVLSTMAAIVVTASFLAPLVATGTAAKWAALLDHKDAITPEQKITMGVVGFLFYFANYLVIVFFNSALVAGALQAIEGRPVSLIEALQLASKRLPQIIGWAALSAVVGTLLRSAENGHRRVGEFVAGLLGTAWTVMTYFVIPVIVVEGLGPIGAIKKSLSVLRSHWGTALVGNVSLGLLGMLIALPLFLAAAGLVALGVAAQDTIALVASIAVAVAICALGAAISSSADMIFKALLFNFATGGTLPEDVSPDDLHEAFRTR